MRPQRTVIKFGIVGDIHCGPDTEFMLGSRAPAMLEVFGEAMRGFRPDCIIDLGDRINDVAAGQDRQRSTWVRKQLLGIGVPVFHVLGNHDVVNLTKTELGSVLDKPSPVETADLDGVRVVVLDSQDPPYEGTGGGIGAGQQRWLARTLAETTHPTVVFCHHPLDEQGLDGHWYFASRPTHAFVRERAQVRKILEHSENVLVVFSGHLHWTRSTAVNGISYVTIGSLVDGAFTNGRPCGTFAAVTMQAKTIEVQVAGLLPEQFRITR